MSKVILITRTDIAEFKDISQTINDKVLNLHINDAQFMDIQPLMGVQFYNDLLRNYTDANYQSLLNEGDYTYNSVTYFNVGLKRVLIDYAYSRYILLGSNKDTPFGHVIKQTDSSVPSSDGNKKTIHKQNQQMAFMNWNNVEEFINRNAGDYPLWNSGSCVVRRGNFRISKIG